VSDAPTEQEASGRPLEGDLKMVLGFWFWFSHCPAPSIGGADGKKRADCLSPP